MFSLRQKLDAKVFREAFQDQEIIGRLRRIFATREVCATQPGLGRDSLLVIQFRKRSTDPTKIAGYLPPNFSATLGTLYLGYRALT